MDEPITDDEYALMHYLRRSVDYPAEGTEAREQWGSIYERFYAHPPHSLERDAWHEAAHAVVAHRLSRQPLKLGGLEATAAAAFGVGHGGEPGQGAGDQLLQ